MNIRPLPTSALLSVVLAVGACRQESPPAGGSPADDPDRQTLGRALYEEPLSDGNSFACATCHALTEPSPDGLRRPGHAIGDATRRRHWKNGKAPTFLAAVNSCLEEWMVAPAWTTTDAHFLALRDFLDAQTTASRAPDVAFEIVPPPADLAGGDSRRGRATFDKTCVVCHGAGGAGTDRGPRVSGSRRTPEYIAKRIRTSGSADSAVYADLTGGVMPFWAKDRLQDDDVRDLVAFLRSGASDGGAPPSDAAVDAGAAPDAGEDAALPGGQDAGVPQGQDAGADVRDAMPPVTDAKPMSGCGRTHPRVGWKADLGINTGEGEVSGFVTMIDDCTLELTQFSYNGDGIEVRVFGSKVKTFRPGFAMGPDLVGRRFVKATLRVQLPADRTLDDLDWVSIWCIKARANFGSGPFLPPQ
jgi:mono/diheme cytochrome c family protein